jgi:hypothetical protein
MIFEIIWMILNLFGINDIQWLNYDSSNLK